MNQPPEPRKPTSGFAIGTLGKGRTTIAASTLQALAAHQVVVIDTRGDLGPQLRRRSEER